ncbi:MAG: transglutaminase-like cysteine peptidase [Brevundimonas sp.]
MHKSPNPSLCLLLGAAAVLLFSPHEASAQAVAMPLGRPAPAPSGFLDFCSRTPEDCLQPGIPVAEVRAQARSLYWAGVFKRASDSPASTGAVTLSSDADAGPRRSAEAPTPSWGNWRRSLPHETSPWRATVGAVRATSPRTPLPARASILWTMTSKDWDVTEQLNRQINRQIRMASDQRQYGVGDYWSVPAGRAPRGDCEDYVLAKRRAMIDLGYPQTAFSIALVETAWGESHAVLLMMTSEGEFVLDNLTPKIARWEQTDYRWVKRQIPGHILEWVAIG